MAALLVAMSVMAVMMTVAMPVWKTVAQREKEEELVFRGEQYARAIGLFQRKFANTAPPTLDILVEQRFLRKKYKDPITNDDFVPVFQMQNAPGTTPNGAGGAATPGAIAPSGPAGMSGTATPSETNRTPQPSGRGGAAGGGASPSPPVPTTGTPGPGSQAGGITGVTSKSKAKSLRLYKGRSHYNEWQFVFTQQTQAPGGVPGQVAPGRGGPGQPTGGGRGPNPTSPGGRGGGPGTPPPRRPGR